MATYKVIQDIEAEDKLVGPLTLRQFIYGAIAALCAYLSFIVITNGAAFLLVIFVPIMFFTGFFAAPWGRDQPTEVWALAKIRFFIKPRRRIWDQGGTKDLVDITVPKQIEKIYSKNLSQTEVRSRLKALANTIDSRGWVIKNAAANLYSPTYSPGLTDSDRLISPGGMPQEVPLVDIAASDDILDEVNNSVAQNLDRLVHASSASHRQQLVDKLKQQTKAAKSVAAGQLSPSADYWFLSQPVDLTKSVTSPNLAQTPLVIPSSVEVADNRPITKMTQNEAVIAKKLKANRQSLQNINYQHMKVIQPINSQLPSSSPTIDPNIKRTSVTLPSDPAKMLLANSNDLSIATIGHIANKQDKQPDEVVISLHDHAS
jgi:hypothetical protein